MRLPQTRKVMQQLRDRSRIIRPNNLKINEWVDDYINRAVLGGKPVEILTQMCISKDLEVRFREQGDIFVPTKKERMLFEKDIPCIADLFSENDIAFNWWMTFNRSYLDSGRINPGVEACYVGMITELAQTLVRQGRFILVDWESEILGKKPEPDSQVFSDIGRFVAPPAMALEIQRHSSWAREEAGLQQTDQELARDVRFQIACEAAEGLLLDGNNSPFGEFLLAPLEMPERYDFFTLRAPGFKKRIVAVLPPYPWRLKNGD